MNLDLLVQNFNTGIVITFIGMVTVLLFLTLMIYVMKAAEKVIQWLNKLFPEELPPEPKSKKKIVGDEAEIALAIAVAAAQNCKSAACGGDK